MLKKNGNSNIITADDITLSGDSANLGETLSDVLVEQNEKLNKLTSNVKWLTKYGGVGGSGSGGSSGATKFKFNINVSYTDLSTGSYASTVWDQTNANKQNLLLVLYNTAIKLQFTITSTYSSTVLYRVTLTPGDDEVLYSQFNENTGTCTIIMYPKLDRVNCTLVVNGDQTITIPFTCFTLIVSLKATVTSGKVIFDNNLAIYPSYIPDLALNLDITSMVPDLYSLSLQSLKVNNQTVDINVDNPLEHSYALADYFPSTEYGLYNIVATYSITEIASSKLEGTALVNYTFVYKDPNTLYIYCYSLNSDIPVLKHATDEFDKPYGGRNVSIVYRIYGTSEDTPNTQYTVSINSTDDPNGAVVQATPVMAQIDQSTSFRNATLEANYDSGHLYKLQAITISVSSSYSITYYIPLLEPPELSYVFKYEASEKDLQNVVTKVKRNCYCALGATTDDNDYTTQSYVSFPPINGSLFLFSQDVNNVMTLNSSAIPTHSPVVLDGTFGTIKQFIETAPSSDASRIYDLMIHIGVNYKDRAYDTPVFTINGNSSKGSISIYRNKIKYGSLTTDRFSMPNDGDYHLITIYIKPWYHTSKDSKTKWESSNFNNVYFAIYIDGILELTPILYNEFLLGPGVNVLFSPGDTTYNLMSMYTFNPRPINDNFVLSYTDTIFRYIVDFDPIIISNFAMVYKNEHCADNTIDKSKYSESIFLSSNSYKMCWNKADVEGVNWINYYHSDSKTTHNKFIPVKVSEIAALIELNESTGLPVIPIYKIVPIYKSNLVTKGMHTSVYNTYKSYGEDDDEGKIEYDCKILKLGSNNQWYDLFDSKYSFLTGTNQAVEEIPVLFYFRYLGSSTLLYGCKNFEIGVYGNVQSTKNENISYDIYFNPNSLFETEEGTMNDGLWRFPETSFNLKADMVDSSSVTNNAIANFVNEYMVSPFNTETTTYQSCLSGYPILLFIDDNTTGTTGNDLFLGIYNVNLNRSSLNNLGYQTLPDMSLNEHVSSVDPKAKLYIRSSSQPLEYASEFNVGEISGNSGLYDFSQTDVSLLKRMFDDFFVYSGGRLSNSYSSRFASMANEFSRYVYTNIIHKGSTLAFNLWDYNYNTTLKTSSDATKPGLLTANPSGLFYLNDSALLTAIPSDGVVVLGSIAENLNPYRSVGSNGVSKVGNPRYQFHVVLTSDGETILNGTLVYYYVQLKASHDWNSDQHSTNLFDLHETLKYYMICMAFGMVDSVQKNLTVKQVGNGKWCPEFYDMDTGLALDNAGANSNFKAFSDYVTANGTIILDYVGLDATSWFDIPSSLLFMYAKYDYLFNESLGNASTMYDYPYALWAILRGISNSYSLEIGYQKLLNAKQFCNNYLYNYIGNKIPPFIWNLNYMYKYFSSTMNTSSTDTEALRFNGTMKYRRLDWMNNRLHYLDALFGVANQRSIGATLVSISPTTSTTSENEDVELVGQMFPEFKKGVTGSINVTITDLPRTPIVFKQNSGTYNLYMTDDTGTLELQHDITSNVDVALYGTYHAISVNECGQFLSNLSTLNTMQGDIISEINITSTKIGNIKLNLEDLPSVKTIKIGSQSSTLTKMQKSITITGGSNLRNLDTLSIYGADLTNSTLVLEKLNVSNLTLTNIKCLEILFLNCFFNLELTISNSITANSIIINGCTIQGKDSSNRGIYVNCNSNALSLSIGGATQVGSSTLGYFNVEVKSGLNVTSLSLNSLTCNLFKLPLITLLNYVSISNLNINKLILNTTWTSSGTSLDNTKLTSISMTQIRPASASYTTLSMPGFNALTNLICTIGNVSKPIRLVDHGLADSQITSLPTTELNGITYDSIIFGSSCIYALYRNKVFDFSTLYAPNTATYTNLILSECKTLRFAFAMPAVSEKINNKAVRIETSLTYLDMKNILDKLTSATDLQMLFCNRKFTHTEDATDEYVEISPDMCAEMGNHLPTKANLAGLFYGTDLGYLTTDLATAIKTHSSKNAYSCVMGVLQNTETTIVETGALSVFNAINTNELYNSADYTGRTVSPDSNDYYSITFIDTLSRSLGVITSKFKDIIPLTTIYYGDEFTNAKYIETSIFTTFATSWTIRSYTTTNKLLTKTIRNSVIFDYAASNASITLATVMSNLESYGGLFKYGSSGVNIKNLENAFASRYNNITFSNFDFLNATAQAWSTSNELTQSKFIDLYTLLVDTSSATHTLRSKIITLNGNLSATGSSHLDCFSFNKKLTISLFIELIGLLRTNKISNISCLFRNCVVYTSSSDQTDYSNILDSQFYYVKYMLRTFLNCKFYKGGTLYYISLNNLFKKHSSEITGNEDLESEIYGSPVNLNYAFAYMYLKPLSDIEVSMSLGVCKYSVNDISYMCYGCKYDYKTYGGSLPTHDVLNNNIVSRPLPSVALSYPLLPEDIFKMCTTSCVYTGAFASDTSTYTKGNCLQGYIPDSALFWGLESCLLSDVFVNDFIFWHLCRSDRQGLTFKLFPIWYANNDGSNKFNVLMSMPVATVGSQCYLFYYEEGAPYVQETYHQGFYITTGLGQEEGTFMVLGEEEFSTGTVGTFTYAKEADDLTAYPEDWDESVITRTVPIKLTSSGELKVAIYATSVEAIEDGELYPLIINNQFDGNKYNGDCNVRGDLWHGIVELYTTRLNGYCFSCSNEYMDLYLEPDGTMKAVDGGDSVYYIEYGDISNDDELDEIEGDTDYATNKFSINSYGRLPHFPGTTGTDSLVTSVYFPGEDSSGWVKPIYGCNLYNNLLPKPLDGRYYSGKIESYTRLMDNTFPFLLYVGNSNTTIFQDLDIATESFYINDSIYSGNYQTYVRPYLFYNNYGAGGSEGYGNVSIKVITHIA